MMNNREYLASLLAQGNRLLKEKGDKGLKFNLDLLWYIRYEHTLYNKLTNKQISELIKDASKDIKMLETF